MGSVTIIVIIPLALILIACSSVIGDITGGDKTKVVLPYEPEKGIVWECDIPMGPVELVETEIDGETQIFFFESTFGKELVSKFAGIAKSIINKEDLPEYENTFGEVYKIIFTDQNGNEQKYYAKTSTTSESIYFDTVDIFAPGEYYAFDCTVTAQQPVEGEYFWFNENIPSKTECFVPDYSPEKTFTVVLTEGFEDGEEHFYNMCYGYYDSDRAKAVEVEYVNITYKIADGSLEILEETKGFYEN